MSETFETIQQWGKDTFGDNITLEGQIEKWHDEYAEFVDTTDENRLSEAADLVIVSMNIARFNLKVGFDYLAQTCHLLYETEYDGLALWEAVEQKMQTNRQHITENKE